VKAENDAATAEFKRLDDARGTVHAPDIALPMSREERLKVGRERY